MEFTLFRDSIKKVSGKRVHKVTKSIGVYDIYKYIRKNKWFNIPRPLTEHEFYTIIRTINKYLAYNLSNGEDVILPLRMGKLELRKKDAKVTYSNGKVKTNRAIDWNTTLKLWYEDLLAFNDNVLIRNESKEIFRVYYNKGTALYNNKSFFDFYINRDIKSILRDKINNKEIDAFKLYE